jgi:Spy/CpxP family protein refolding chaperone
MKKHLNIFIPVALAILLGSLTFIFAQTVDNRAAGPRPEKNGDFGPPPPPPEFGRGGPGGFNPRIFDQLALTDTQKEQIRAIEFNSREASKEHFGKIKAADDQLRMMIDGGTFTEALARPIVRDKAQTMTELELIRLGTEAAINKLLTAEQKTQLAQLREKRPSFPPGGGFGPGK